MLRWWDPPLQKKIDLLEIINLSCDAQNEKYITQVDYN